MGYFVQVEVIDCKVGSLVDEAAILGSHTEVVSNVEFESSSVYECGFGFLIDAGVHIPGIIGWAEHQRSSAGECVRSDVADIHRNVRDECSRYFMKVGPY